MDDYEYLKMRASPREIHPELVILREATRTLNNLK